MQWSGKQRQDEGDKRQKEDTQMHYVLLIKLTPNISCYHLFPTDSTKISALSEQMEYTHVCVETLGL